MHSKMLYDRYAEVVGGVVFAGNVSKTQVFHTQIERFFNRSFVARTPQKSAPTVAAGTGHGAGGRERGAAADRQIVPAQAQKRPCVVEGAMGAPV